MQLELLVLDIVISETARAGGHAKSYTNTGGGRIGFVE
jgi:hypothetical protein